MMMGREVRNPDQFTTGPALSQEGTQEEFVAKFKENLDNAHQLLRDQQQSIRMKDAEGPLLFAEGDLV